MVGAVRAAGGQHQPTKRPRLQEVAYDQRGGEPQRRDDDERHQPFHASAHGIPLVSVRRGRSLAENYGRWCDEVGGAQPAATACNHHIASHTCSLEIRALRLIAKITPMLAPLARPPRGRWASRPRTPV